MRQVRMSCASMQRRDLLRTAVARATIYIPARRPPYDDNALLRPPQSHYIKSCLPPHSIPCAMRMPNHTSSLVNLVASAEDYSKLIGTLDGLKVIERFFTLPLDYGNPEGPKIRVFARNLFSIDKAKTPEEQAALPYCTCTASVSIVCQC